MNFACTNKIKAAFTILLIVKEKGALGKQGAGRCNGKNIGLRAIHTGLKIGSGH